MTTRRPPSTSRAPPSYAAERHAGEAVLAHVASALALPGSADDPALCWRLLEVRERTLRPDGQARRAAADIEHLEHLAEAIDDDTRRAEAAWRRSDFSIRTGDFRAGEAAARGAIAHAELAGATRCGSGPSTGSSTRSPTWVT